MKYSESSVEEDTCITLAGLWDDPTQNNFDCPWDWKQQQLESVNMARLNKGSSPHDKLAKLLDNMDKEGFGYHVSIVKTAGILNSCNVPPEKAIEMMHKASEKVTRRELEPGEIERAVNYTYQSSGEPSRYVKPKRKVSAELINEFGCRGDIDDLRSRSDNIPDQDRILAELYKSDTLLHLCREVFNGRDVKPRADWVNDGLEPYQYICPNPLKGLDRGRCLDNILSRKFVVFESDHPNIAGNWDIQAGLIDRLAKDMPLRMIVWSGNKSLHAWFQVEGKEERKVYKFLNLATMLGADSASLRPSQLVRMPWGKRTDNNKVQKVIYYG